MKRREFLALTGAGAAALLAGGVEQALAAPRHIPRPRGKWQAIVGCQSQQPTDDGLRFYARYGVQAMCGWLPDTRMHGWTVENLSRFRERVESFGIQLAMMQIQFWEWPNVFLGKSPERDRELDQVCRAIATAAKVGIPAIKYNWTARELGVLRTTPTPGRGGADNPTWDEATAMKETALTALGVMHEDTMWENITYMLERVMPVAKEYKIRMACHPQDPPTPPGGFRGLHHPLSTVAGLKRFVRIAENEYHGLNFCQGTLAEMLENPAEEIYDVIRYFGRRKKIFNVHFRNIRGKRGKFQEVFPDEGDVDMLKAMRIYREIGYPYMIMPDHVPSHAEDPFSRQGFAFGYGYIKALMQAVNAE